MVWRVARVRVCELGPRIIFWVRHKMRGLKIEIPGSSSSAGSESSRNRFLSGGDSALSTKEALRLPRKDILSLR